MLSAQFQANEEEVRRLLNPPGQEEENPNLPVIAAYELTLRCSHLFNLLDARGALSVRERAAYIGRVRACARMCAQAWIRKREALGWPLLIKQ